MELEDLKKVSIKDIEEHKLIKNIDLVKDIKKLREFDVSTNKNSFCGNSFLYHHQLKNLLNCKRENGLTIYELFKDTKKWEKLLESTLQRNRKGKTIAGNVWECFRINLGSVVMFKSITAKYLYKKYNATAVLDPTAGWGGRMLGAWALDIDYTGIDTNINMKGAYDNMINFLYNFELFESNSKLEMLWEDALTVDFAKINYDFVLTSPPYVNLEIYENMTTWDSDKAFYTKFLIPLIKKCRKHIKNNGNVCFNISPKMYEDALSFGLYECDEEEDLKQQMGDSNKKQDKIYIWKNKSK